MAKSSQFVCQNCGSVSTKWSGKCESCGEWNAIVEEQAAAPLSGAMGARLLKGRPSRLVGLKGESPAPPRIITGIGELDRVAGGGFVPGSGVLIGGDPGIGTEAGTLEQSMKHNFWQNCTRQGSSLLMIVDQPSKNFSPYDYFQPLEDFGLSDKLLMELVGTPAFQRLKSIRFLGGIDYLLKRSPNGAKTNVRYTRYQHSLGVARLALYYSQARELPFEVRRLVFVAALLHDVGHAPLSHSLEPVFKEFYGMEHHQATEDIICGRVPIGREVHQKLKVSGICIEQLTAIIAGQDRGYDGFFSGPINFDTIEGILRTQAFIRPRASTPNPVAVTDAAIRRIEQRDQKLVDEFWQHKDAVYRYAINSRDGILADYACQMYMRKNISQFEADDYYATEEDLFLKMPGLLELLKSRSFMAQMRRQTNGSVGYKFRHFFVDGSGDFFAREDVKRYKQVKEHRNMSIESAPEFLDEFPNQSGLLT